MNHLPEGDEVFRDKVYGRCSVVGSSGIVLNYEHGREIDASDMVIRFNSAPTKGFEKHVGSFTTHRITNTQNWGFHETTKERILIHFRAKSAVKGIFWNARQKRPLRLYAFDPDFVEFMAHSLNFMATSGLYGMMLAVQRCKEVVIYGFHVSTTHGALYHYYDVCDVPANVLRDDTEWLAVKALAAAGLVRFGEPCIVECHESPEECDSCKTETNFQAARLPSNKKCDPNAVSHGHLAVPWRRSRNKFKRP